MSDDVLAAEFEEHRDHLRAVALRMLGSEREAEDAVQEAWLRLSRSDADAIDNLGGWLTTVVSRISIDMLRSRASRREDPGADVVDLASARAAAGGGGVASADPEDHAVLADSVGAALQVVLDTLSPSERLAFVLHDMFAVPFEEIGEVLGRSPSASKQLASRARRKVQGADADGVADRARQREVVDAFLAASRRGDFEALVSLLDPAVVLRADATAVRMGSPEELAGPQGVAGMFSGRALGAEVAEIDGGAGLVWIVDGRPKVAWDFIVEDGTIIGIDMLAASDTLDVLELQVADDRSG